MTAAPNPMRDLYRRLSEAGFSRPYVRDVVLPDWWDDDAAKTDEGFAEAAMIVARNLGFDYRSVRDVNQQLSPLPQMFPPHSTSQAPRWSTATPAQAAWPPVE